MTNVGLRRAVSAVTIAAFGCAPSPITSTRIEAAVASTFANLVHLQLSRVGLSPVAAADIKVTASCHKSIAGSSATGAGDWVCSLVWFGPNRQPLLDTYDLSVGTDGCYTATVESAEDSLGGPTVLSPDGSQVRNLLYVFEGCFDTT